MNKQIKTSLKNHKKLPLSDRSPLSKKPTDKNKSRFLKKRHTPEWAKQFEGEE